MPGMSPLQYLNTNQQVPKVVFYPIDYHNLLSKAGQSSSGGAAVHVISCPGHSVLPEHVEWEILETRELKSLSVATMEVRPLRKYIREQSMDSSIVIHIIERVKERKGPVKAMLESIRTVRAIGTEVNELTVDEFSGVATGSQQRSPYRISRQNPDYCSKYLFLQKMAEIKDATIRHWDYSKGPNPCVNFGSSGGIEPFTLTKDEFATMDLLLAGEPRVWVIVSSRHRGTLVKMLLQEGVTSQEFFLSPKLLLKSNIPITIAVQKPGEMMIIRTGALTQVTNRGWSSSLIVKYAEESQLQPSRTLGHGCCQERSRGAGRTLSLPEWTRRAYLTWFPHPSTCKYCARVLQNYIQVVNHELKHERGSSQCPGCGLLFLFQEIKSHIHHHHSPEVSKFLKTCLSCHEKFSHSHNCGVL